MKTLHPPVAVDLASIFFGILTLMLNLTLFFIALMFIDSLERANVFHFLLRDHPAYAGPVSAVSPWQDMAMYLAMAALTIAGLAVLHRKLARLQARAALPAPRAKKIKKPRVSPVKLSRLKSSIAPRL